MPIHANCDQLYVPKFAKLFMSKERGSCDGDGDTNSVEWIAVDRDESALLTYLLATWNMSMGCC